MYEKTDAGNGKYCEISSDVKSGWCFKQIGQLYSPCTSLLLNPDGASKQIGQQYCPPCTSKLSNPDGASKQIGQQ
jgi:hypothetical protein